MLESKSPTPKYVAAEELRVLQACLQRWRTEVEADVKGNFSIHVSWLIHTAREWDRNRDGHNRKQWFLVPVPVPVWCVQYIA